MLSAMPVGGSLSEPPGATGRNAKMIRNVRLKPSSQLLGRVPAFEMV